MPASIPVTVIEDSTVETVVLSKTAHGFDARVSPGFLRTTTRKSGDWGHELQLIILHEIYHLYPELHGGTVHLL